MTDNVYGEAYQIFCQHLQDSVTEEMFEAMVLCAISGRWLVIGTENITLPIQIYRLTNPVIGKHQNLIINHHNVPLCDDVYSENDYIIATKTDENLFYLANRLSAIKRWCVPDCLLPLYDEIQQSFPHPAVYFDHPCENHFLDTAIQQLKVDIEKWTQQRRIWYQQIVDDLQLKLKERYHYVRVEKNPFDKNEYEARFCYRTFISKTFHIDTKAQRINRPLGFLCIAIRIKRSAQDMHMSNRMNGYINLSTFFLYADFAMYKFPLLGYY